MQREVIAWLGICPWQNKYKSRLIALLHERCRTHLLKENGAADRALKSVQRFRFLIL